jgi:hypothetical protein
MTTSAPLTPAAKQATVVRRKLTRSCRMVMTDDDGALPLPTVCRSGPADLADPGRRAGDQHGAPRWS